MPLYKKHKMAKEKKSEPKIILEREYIVPLRRGFQKVPEYKRANKAVKTLKEFMVRHMKIYDRDLRKIKVDIILNNEIRYRGMRNPLAKIKVKAIKYDNDIVKVELVNIPDHIKFARLREEKSKAKPDKKESKKAKVSEEPKKEDKDQTVEAKEKEEASRDEGLKISKEQAREQKHTSKDKKVIIQRKALSR